jgi:hypothetical protein
MGAALVALLAIAGCVPRADRSDWLAVQDVTPSFLVDLAADHPAIAADAHGRVALTWVTRDSLGSNLWVAVSRDSGFTFEPPARVNLRPASVAFDPDNRPVVAFGPAGQLAIAWSEVRDTSGALDLVVRASGDAGGLLGMPVVVNPAAAPPPPRPRRWRRPPPALPALHGHGALTYLPDGSLFAAWLETRGVPAPGPPAVSALHGALSVDGGQSWSGAIAISDSACGRCRPSAASDAAGRIAVAYRSAAGDLRDPALAVSTDRGATFPLDTIVSADRWRLHDCPAEAPALAWNDASGGSLAWYTGAGPTGVFLMPWHPDHGAAGIKRPLQDGVTGARRPRLSAGGSATWLGVEAAAPRDTARAVLAVGLAARDGSLTPWVLLGADVADIGLAALDERTAVVCWSERREDGARLRVARLRRR